MVPACSTEGASSGLCSIWSFLTSDSSEWQGEELSDSYFFSSFLKFPRRFRGSTLRGLFCPTRGGAFLKRLRPPTLGGLLFAPIFLN